MVLIGSIIFSSCTKCFGKNQGSIVITPSPVVKRNPAGIVHHLLLFENQPKNICNDKSLYIIYSIYHIPLEKSIQVHQVGHHPSTTSTICTMSLVTGCANVAMVHAPALKSSSRSHAINSISPSLQRLKLIIHNISF